MTDPIAEAFRRLEEWADAGRSRSYRHDRFKDLKGGGVHYTTLYELTTEDGISGVGPTIPAAVDAALKAWEKDNA